MKKYAIIKIQGHQYKVSEGDEILVDKLNDKKANPDVLLFTDGKKTEIGKPVLSNVTVKIKVLAEEKGKKLTVLKYKAKSRYRKKIGFRPQFTRLQIEKITLK